jgi:hypothetical protein
VAVAAAVEAKAAAQAGVRRTSLRQMFDMGPWPCCCFVPKLVTLHYVQNPQDPGFLYYRVVDGDPQTREFRISCHSSFCGHYRIDRHSRFGGWSCLGYFRLQIPQ